MNILFISDYFQPFAVGAANISTYLIAKEFSRANNCYVITQKFQKQPWVYDGLTVNPLLPRYSSDKDIKDIIKTEIFNFLSFHHIFSFYLKIQKFCKANNIDLINVQSNNLTLLIALLFLNKPVVIDVRDYYFTCPFMLKTRKCGRFHLSCLPDNSTKRVGNFANFLSTVFFRYQTLTYFIEKNFIFKPLLLVNQRKCVFIANSYYVRERLLQEFKRIDINAQVIYNTINKGAYKGLNLTKKKRRVILFASALEKSKGIWECIYAFEKLNKDVTFEIAGDGAEMDLIREYIQKKSIKGIKLLGKLEYKFLPELYKSAYITVQPSVWPEPFGRYILESFASGTPLITTPTGGTPEIITDKETGLLVPTSDSRMLSRAMRTLLTDKKLYRNIQKNIVDKAINFRPEVIAAQRLALYKSFFGKNDKKI